MAMRRHDFLVELMELARAQEMMIARAHAQEEQELAMALARSMSEDQSVSSGAPPPLPLVNSLDRIDDVCPSLAFKDAKGFLLASGSEEEGGAPECVVCLNVFEPSDRVRLLGCVHAFHAKCIDKWLQRSAACPTCKQKVELGG